MSGEVILLLLACLVLLALFTAGVRNLEKASKSASYAQALFTLVAFITTAYWFIVERKGEPHADVSQELHVVPLGEGLVAVEAHITVQNLGQRLLNIDRINSRLQLVRSDTYDYAGLNALRGDEYWEAKRPGSDADQFHYSELRWPILRRYNREVKNTIEPGETDLFVVSFLMECRLAERIRVASDIYKPGPASSEETVGEGAADAFAWKTRSFASLDEAC